MSGQVPFRVDKDSSLTLTRQVAEGVRDAILSGFYKPGDQLPSRDVLAAELGVSEYVVRAALSELSADRMVIGRPRLGYRVSGTLPKRKGKVVLDVSLENYGSYSYGVSLVECARAIRRAGHCIQQVVLGLDSPDSPFLSPLKAALAQRPDFVLLRTVASLRKTVTAMVVDAGCPYATVTLGSFRKSPGRYVGEIRLDPSSAIAEFADDCVAAGVLSVLQVDMGPDTFVSAEKALASRKIAVERLSVRRSGSDDLDAIVQRAFRTMDGRIAKGGLPDLVLVTDDYLALGVCEALRKRRIRIPEDVKFVGYANQGSGLFPFKDMARLEFAPRRDGREIGRCIVEYLDTGIFGQYENPLLYRRGKSFPMC